MIDWEAKMLTAIDLLGRVIEPHNNYQSNPGKFSDAEGDIITERYLKVRGIFLLLYNSQKVVESEKVGNALLALNLKDRDPDLAQAIYKLDNSN